MSAVELRSGRCCEDTAERRKPQARLTVCQSAKGHANVLFAKLNVDEHGEIAQELGIRSIPTVIFFKNGQEINRYVGAMGKPQLESSPAEQVVASHVASLGPARRLVEVASTDRHVVKPWFQGKVDFAPVVRDLSAEGYALLGGRLDHVAEGQAVAIVYKVREHVVSLFVWRAANPRDEPLALSSARGFSVASWSEAGLRFAAVSDAEAREIEHFARLVLAQR